MEVSSVKTRKFVKPKPAAFPASPDSGDPQQPIPPADQPAKPAQAQDLQKSDPGARAGSGLRLDIPVLCGESKGKRISLMDRYALAIIIAHVGYSRWGYLSEDTISQEMRCHRSTASRAVNDLKAAGCLDVDDSDKCNRYRVPGWVFYLSKIWVKPSMVRDDGFSILVACCTSYVKFLQGKNDETWPTIQEFADALGVSYHTAARGTAESADRSLIQKTHRPERRSWKNKYRLTCRGKEATGVFELKTARPKCGALGQTTREEDIVYANSVRNGSFRAQFGLSFSPDQDQKPYELLVCIGVNRFVAKPVAAQHRKDPESVENMIWNWTGKTEQSRRYWQGKNLPAPRIPLAGYVIGGLNIGIAECHSIKLSSAGREAKTRGKGAPGLAGSSRMTEAEFERRKKEKIRALLSTPAKPYTPQELAKFAEERRLPDKKTQEEFLTAHLTAARRRDYGYRRLANLGQKVGFCLDKVK